MFLRYADGECSVLIGESVLGKDVIVVSPTHTNDSLVELLLIIGAARRWGRAIGVSAVDTRTISGRPVDNAVGT